MTKKILGSLMFVCLVAWILSSMAPVAMAADAQNPSPPSQMQAASAKVDLNSATAQQLESLPGIGPALAQRIVAHRQSQGPFKSIDDLKLVKGIGNRKFTVLRDKIMVSQ